MKKESIGFTTCKKELIEIYCVNLNLKYMELEKPKKIDSFLAKFVIFFIVLATIFTIYLTVKLVVSGFTFR